MKKSLLLLIPLLSFINAYAQQNISGGNHFREISEIDKNAAKKRFLKGVFNNASGNFNVYYYRCGWKVDPAVYNISGEVTSYFITTSNTQSITFDLANQLTVDSILSNGNKLNFLRDTNNSVTINFLTLHVADQKDSVSVYYHGKPAENNQGYFVTAAHNDVPVLWTLSEPYGGRDWWPCRNGLDDKADSIDIILSYPSKYKSSSNGLLANSITTGNSTTDFYKHRYPIAAYLVAIAVTNYTLHADTLQLDNIVLPNNTHSYPEDSANFASRNHFMKQIFHLYNKLYDEYPFINEKYDQTEFGFSGGQEHQTNSFVHYPDEGLMAHELAHQWFGDKITCANWQDIWLNEGFAEYSADFLYSQNFSPLYYPLHVAGNLAYIVSQPGGSVFVDDTSTVDRIFDSRLTYAKGSFLVRMLQWTLGDSLFFKAVHQYLEDPSIKYGFAHSADLQRNLESASGLNLKYFFDQWLYGQGYPEFTIHWTQNTNNFAAVNISEITSHPSVSFFKVPLQLIFKNATQQKAFVINDSVNNLQTILDVGFSADSVLIDPQHWLISAKDSAIKNTSSTNKNIINIYPNPFSSQIVISLKNPADKNLNVLLYNVRGQKLLSNSYALSGADETFFLPLASLPHGVYFLKLQGETLNYKKKLVK